MALVVINQGNSRGSIEEVVMVPQSDHIKVILVSDGCNNGGGTTASTTTITIVYRVGSKEEARHDIQ